MASLSGDDPTLIQCHFNQILPCLFITVIPQHSQLPGYTRAFEHIEVTHTRTHTHTGDLGESCQDCESPVRTCHSPDPTCAQAGDDSQHRNKARVGTKETCPDAHYCMMGKEYPMAWVRTTASSHCQAQSLPGELNKTRRNWEDTENPGTKKYFYTDLSWWSTFFSGIEKCSQGLNDVS